MKKLTILTTMLFAFTFANAQVKRILPKGTGTKHQVIANDTISIVLKGSLPKEVADVQEQIKKLEDQKQILERMLQNIFRVAVVQKIGTDSVKLISYDKAVLKLIKQ